MQINKENLTIVIVTIKSENVIRKCLDSIHQDINKIIIENSKDEKLFNDLKKDYSNLECYSTGKNYGMGKGNNFGIKKSKTRYVMVLNPDTILKDNTLDEIFKVSNQLDFAILSPISDNDKFPNYKTFKQLNNINEDLFEVDCVDGYAMILDKQKFNDEYFDEKIFMYLENDDLCFRVKKKGEKIYVFKKALINHLGAKAVDDKFSEELQLSRNWHLSWSKFYYRKKHYGFLFAFSKGFPSFLSSCLKCFLFLFIYKKFKSKIYFNKASGFFNSLMNKNSWYRPKI